MIPDLIPRHNWEEPGWTVEEHTTSGPQPWASTLAVIVHYTAAATTPENEAPVRDYIRRIQRDYVTDPKRGYSIGYNWVVDRQGRVWEARGDDFKCAANGNSTTNLDPAVLCLVNGADPANLPMIAAVRDVVAHCQDMTGRTLAIKGHRDVRATTCPGDGLYAQVQNDIFRPEEGEDVNSKLLYILKPYTGAPAGLPWFLRDAGTWSYLTGRDRELLVADGVPVYDDLRERYENVHRQVFGRGWDQLP